MKPWGYIAIGLVIWAAWYYADQESGSTSSGGLGAAFTATWAEAIAGFENVNPAYNNPGGLNSAGNAGSVPAAGGTGHDVIGVFSSFLAGFNALQATLDSFVAKYGGKSLLDATAIYVLGPNGAAAAAGNYPANVVNEANYVANQMGVDVNSTLDDLEGDSE